MTVTSWEEAADVGGLHADGLSASAAASKRRANHAAKSRQSLEATRKTVQNAAEEGPSPHALRTFLKLQPHTSDFLDISDHYVVLTRTLENMGGLTQGAAVRVSDGRRAYLTCSLPRRASGKTPRSTPRRPLPLRRQLSTRSLARPSGRDTSNSHIEMNVHCGSSWTRLPG